MFDIIKDHEKYAWKEGFKEGRKEGKNATYLIFVKRMLDKGLSPEKIREYLVLTQKQMDEFFTLSVTN